MLEQIGRKLSEVYDIQNTCEKDRVTVNLETDYLAIKNRIELLLPRSEKLKNFTFVQSHHLVPIDLRLIKLGCLIFFDFSKILKTDHHNIYFDPIYFLTALK